MGLDLLQMLGILFAIAIIFFLAWFVTRAVALNGSFTGKGKHFKIVERLPITKDSYIMLLKSFDKYLLVGVTAGGMTVLEEFDAESVNLSDFLPEKQSFSSILKNTLDSTLPEGKVRDKIEKYLSHKKGGDGDE